MAEIGGDDIAREVMVATDGIQEESMLLLNVEEEPVKEKKEVAKDEKKAGKGGPKPAAKPANQYESGVEENPKKVPGAHDWVFGEGSHDYTNSRNGYHWGHVGNDNDPMPVPKKE